MKLMLPKVGDIWAGSFRILHGEEHDKIISINDEYGIEVISSNNNEDCVCSLNDVFTTMIKCFWRRIK